MRADALPPWLPATGYRLPATGYRRLDDPATPHGPIIVGVVPDAAQQYDVFVSHASDDKARFVEPLIAALCERGVRVWVDHEQIRIGDDFRRRIDDGLSRSRFGVVILSPHSFKYWTQAELSALFNQEAALDQTRILPLRCDLDRATVVERLPLLSARADLGWELGVRAIAERIHDRVREAPSLVRPTHTRVYNLPARRARELFGRESDLVRLEELLLPGRNVHLAASIEGLAGVGKTELALHLVDRLSEAGRFPGGIFWLDAENPDLTLAWGTTIADGLAVGAGTLEERAAAAVRIASGGSPVLVVLDNVEQWTRASEPRPLPHGAQVALLVTTRHRFLAGPSFTHHSLETLPENAARKLLVSVAGRDLDADDLLRFLDGHTLAIELAGAYLREFPGVTPAAYLSKLAQGLPVEEKVQDLVRYESTVRRALDVHWTKLEAAAREALLVAACFAPEDASIALLEACGVDDGALQPLRRFHLIAGDGERWRMHRLVREWARHHASGEDLARARRAFVEGCVAFSRTITLEEGYRVYRNDGPHLDEAVRDAEAVLGSGDARVSELWDRVATALQSMGELSRAKELLERALASEEKNLGEEHPSVATRRSNLAGVLKDLGELPRAKELLERALASVEKNLGEEHPSVAIRRFNLGTVARDQGDLARARELFAQTLAAKDRALGANHPSTAFTQRFAR